MKKQTRRAVTILVVIGVLAIIVYVALMTTNSMVRKAVEISATQAMGVDVRIKSMSIRPFSSQVTIYGLDIASPPEFESRHLLTLLKGHVDASLPSLFSQVVKVREIVLDSPDLALDVKFGIPPRSNLGETLKTVQSRLPKPEEKKLQKQFLINRIIIASPKVRVRSFTGTTTASLPDVELRDVRNTDGSPVVIGDVLFYGMNALGEAVAANVKGYTPGDIEREQKPKAAAPAPQ